MQQFASRQSIIDFISERRQQGDRIALVPTMGNLHDGHLSLIERAHQLAQTVVASIYVNPMQFDQEADLQRYPRTLQQDLAKLAALNVHAVFLPDDKVLYPDGLARSTVVRVPVISEILCGAHRPGHFDGVSTVVAKLFGVVRPDVAVFGSKDFQQLMLIRHMVDDLCIPIKIEAADIVREANGLAMSSRNSRLSDKQMEQAGSIYRLMQQLAQRIVDGDRDWSSLEQWGMEQLLAAGFEPDYIVVRQCADLQTPDTQTPLDELVILAAANLDAARLIDNLQLKNFRLENAGK